MADERWCVACPCTESQELAYFCSRVVRPPKLAAVTVGLFGDPGPRNYEYFADVPLCLCQVVAMERRARAGFDGEHFNVLPEGVFEGLQFP